MPETNNHWVLITGAGSGIGQQTAHRMAQAGHPVFLLGRTRSKLEKVADELPTRSHILACDLATADEVEKAIHSVQKVLKETDQKLSYLVNNAGIIDRKKFVDSSDGLWERNFQVNLLGPIRLTRGLIPLLDTKSGAILNVASTLGLRPVPETSVYSAMKAAMINWTQTLALELASTGIRVNCVCPGIVETPIHGLEKMDDAEELKKTMHAMQPLARMGRPEEIAEAIYFLTSPSSAWTTGSILTVDGGINLT